MPRQTNRPRSNPVPIARPARPADLEVIVAMASALWPREPVRGHRVHMRAILIGAPPSTLPLTLFVAERHRAIVGFLEVGLRSHADGCDARRPVGYVEGWFVAPDHRGQDVGRALMNAAEEWAVAQGCTELASDTWLDNEPSRRAHEALGFEIVDRCINFKKALRRQGKSAAKVASAGTGTPTPRQGQFLAFIRDYRKLHGRAPAEADMVRFFQVSPPTVHTMVKILERRGFIAREPGQARSIRLLIPER
jgi:aminoglycoside 6'-N-acetyltransferase I